MQWVVYTCQYYPYLYRHANPNRRVIVLLAGNFSPLLTTSGVFFEVIVLTAGQYGYELILGFASA
jgi:hypothetical protein